MPFFYIDPGGLVLLLAPDKHLGNLYGFSSLSRIQSSPARTSTVQSQMTATPSNFRQNDSNWPPSAHLCCGGKPFKALQRGTAGLFFAGLLPHAVGLEGRQEEEAREVEFLPDQYIIRTWHRLSGLGNIQGCLFPWVLQRHPHPLPTPSTFRFVVPFMWILHALVVPSSNS